ncbi:MAG: hypothetical protein ACLUI3_11470 [Christensenellales bacterium]
MAKSELRPYKGWSSARRSAAAEPLMLEKGRNWRRRRISGAH